ncbi:MAG: ArsR family transcriptional regulator [Bacteriovoracaceae bacterium]|nr:ArsR family transcriptional regulator [Bacteriovoracaceae bacterium]
MNKKFQLLNSRQDDIFTSIAGILGGIAAPVRIKLIHYLSQAPLTVEVLAKKIDQSVANTSMHLRKMLSENLVSVISQGQKRVYSLHPAALEFWESCQDFVQKIDPSLFLESEDIFGDVAWDKDLAETVEMAKQNEVIFLDVRPDDESVEDLNLPYVVHIAAQDLEEKISKLPKRKSIIVFCRGRLCSLSVMTVNDLRKKGFKAYRLDKSWFALKNYLSKKK